MESEKENKKNLILIILKSVFLFVLFYTAFSITIIFSFKFINPPTSSFIELGRKIDLFNFSSEDSIKQTWKSIDKISPNIILAVIASEDQRFFEHHGFDLEEIEKVIDDIQNDKRIRGASTISQQLAKNMFLSPSKNLLRKVFESYFTFLIELVLSKKRILEIYLNFAEFDKNIFGVEEAGKNYFNKSCSYLNNYESAMLAAVLPNPKKRDAKNPSDLLIKRKDKIIEKMKSLGGIEFIDQKLN